MNDSPKSSYPYQLGGSLNFNHPTYVVRQADKDFYDFLKRGEFCYVLNSRQTGKSSLRVQTMARLLAEGIACAEIDLTGIGSQQITTEQWYGGIIQEIASSFDLHFNRRAWWRERDSFSPVQRFNEFIEKVLLEQVRQNIVIFMDEIDSVLRLKFKDDFFAVIRNCYNKRADKPEYRRLTFALLGVSTPSDLIRETDHTPFNIGQAIELDGFQLHEAQPLVKGLALKTSNPQAVLREVLTWTGGQPFLTQKLCQLVLTSTSPIPAGSEAKCVEHLVCSRIIENWESQDEPEHLKTIRDRILRSEQSTGWLLRLYEQILRKNEITADGSPEQMQLRLSGLVVKQQGSLRAYNPIYASIFNQSWVDKALSDLRPYGWALEAWVAADYQDESQLLRGQALQDAQAWAEGRSLSKRDYQFLTASQEVETRKLQIALSAQKNSRQTLPSKRRFQTMLLLSMVVTALVMGVRQLGMLQTWELQAFDHLIRLRPDEGPDPRLLAVTITESDIQTRKEWPLSDKTLAQLLAKLERYQPRVIGLDIYRDLHVGPRQTNLVPQWLSPHLIAVCETSAANKIGIPPPPKMSNDRLGFSDVVVDPDGILRRHLLYMTTDSTSPCPANYAFSLQVAYRYLAAEGIQPQEHPKQYLQIGATAFKPLEAQTGGYLNLDARGHQVLLNYRSSSNVAEQVTLSDILNDRFDPNLVKNRIVLIGVTAASVHDDFSTPYTAGTWPRQKLPGVLVQAQMVSQILSAVLDGRPLLWVWSAWGEILWVFCWSLVGNAIAWNLKWRLPLRLALIAVALGNLYGFCFVLLLQGGWIPLVPSALALAVAAGSTAVAYVAPQTKRQPYNKKFL